jgi:hypothetical protein
VHPVIHHGALVDAVREQLCSRAQKLGWTEDKDPAPELEIDGTVHQPTAAGPLSVFIFPTTAKCVRLLSKSFVPGDIGSGSDPRTLGLSLQSLKLVGRSKVAEIPLDALDTPYPIESEVDRRWRWTDGALKLSPKLWTGFEEKTLALYVAYDAGALRGWTRPNVALHSNTSHSRLRLVDTAHQRRIRAV